MSDQDQAFTAPAVDPAPEPAHHDPAPEDTGAAGRLRAFEDEMFGPDAVRVGGHIERGSGSKFQSLTAEQRRYYAALEALVLAEKRRIDAEAEVVLAETAYAAAIDAVEQSNEEMSNGHQDA